MVWYDALSLRHIILLTYQKISLMCDSIESQNPVPLIKRIFKEKVRTAEIFIPSIISVNYVIKRITFFFSIFMLKITTTEQEMNLILLFVNN